MGKRLSLAIGLVGLLVLALASPASAVWTHKGKGELKENASVTLKGTVTLSTSAGNVVCATEIGGTLTASSSSGHVNSFTVAKPSECDLTGSLAAICGTNGLTKVEKTGTWGLTADETDITITGINIDYTLAGCLIPSFRLEGNATASLDKATAIGSATLSGSQTLYNAAGESSGSGELKGTLAVTPAGTYGVKTASTIETQWTDEGKQLSKDGELTLTGTFSFSGSGGGVSCPASMKLQLESSTVEEEEPEGQLTSFAVAKPGECDVTGTLGTLCGTKSVTSVEQTGTGSLTATEEDITAFGLVLDYKFTGCGVTSLKIEGGPTISVTSPNSIASATFSAGSLQVYNAEGEKTGTATAGGSATASPSGTYQLVAESHEEITETEETAETEATETEETAHTAHTEHTEETAATPGSGLEVWTYEGELIEIGSKVQEEYEGFLQFTTPAPPLPVHTTFGCDVTLAIQVTGTVDEKGSAKVTQYSPTTMTCEGTGVFTECILVHDTSNPPWDIDTGATNLTITGPITVTNVYETGCPVSGSEITFNSLALTATPGENGFSSISLEGTATNGVTKTSGTFFAETEGLLGGHN